MHMVIFMRSPHIYVPAKEIQYLVIELYIKQLIGHFRYTFP